MSIGRKAILALLIGLNTLLTVHNAFSQHFDEAPAHSYDSIKVKANRFVFVNDSAYYVHKDTICVIPDTVEFHVRKNNLDRTSQFYERIDSSMSKSKVSDLVHDFLFRDHHKGELAPHAEELSEQRFVPFEREAVKKIDYKYLPVFGSDINDTSVFKPKKWERPLNKVHGHTRKWVIGNNIMFSKGDKISPKSFVDSERLLRRLDYIRDARILVKDYERHDEADVIVVTKDVFPYDLKIRPTSDALFGISNINIGGTGHELEYDYIKDGGSEFFYRIRNIQHTFIDSEINVSDHFRKSGYGFFLEKEFLTEDTKYAGGSTFSRYRFGESLVLEEGELPSRYTYDQRYSDFWIGRSFRTSIKTNALGLKDNTRAIVSAKVAAFDFFERPEVREDTSFRFHDRTTYLLSIGFSSRNYHKDRFIQQFGRMEDIPTGTAIGIILGHQSTEFRERTYLGLNYARGGYIHGFGYLNTIGSIGSFVNHEGFTDGVIKVGGDYFTKLFALNQFHFRQFINLSVSNAIDPSEEIILSSDTDFGVRGISGTSLLATHKINLKSESLLFTPSYFLGFRIATFGFIDYSKIVNGRRIDSHNTDLFTMGTGLRLRNDNLAFSTLQIRLGYKVNTFDNTSGWQVSIATSTRILIRDFDFKAPELIPFK